MKRTEIRIAGYGGQGVIRAASILANAACLLCDTEVAEAQSYGPEARGGVCKADIIISDEKVDYPLIENPDILIVMSNEAYNSYHSQVKPTGLIILDSTLVRNLKETNLRTYEIQATEISEKIGNPIASNIILLGAFTSITSLITPECMKKALTEGFPPEYRETNFRAFEKGYNFGLEIKERY